MSFVITSYNTSFDKHAIAEVRTLIKAGANVNWKDSQNQTAIDCAIELSLKYDVKQYVPIIGELIKGSELIKISIF